MTYARRPEADEYPASMAGYVARIPPGEDILSVLARQVADFAARLGSVPEARGDHRYRPGKWSIKEVVGHLSDTERVFTYRALHVARSDPAPLTTFDDKAYVPELYASERSLASMAAEWRSSRESTLALFRNLPERAWSRRGTVDGAPVSVRALAWIVAGHTDHHLETLAARYGLGGTDSGDGAEVEAPVP